MSDQEKKSKEEEDAEGQARRLGETEEDAEG